MYFNCKVMNVLLASCILHIALCMTILLDTCMHHKHACTHHIVCFNLISATETPPAAKCTSTGAMHDNHYAPTGINVCNMKNYTLIASEHMATQS